MIAVRDRHPGSGSAKSLSDQALATAKQALIEHGALEHITGPTNKLTQEAIRGIQSWKQKVVSFDFLSFNFVATKQSSSKLHDKGSGRTGR